MTGISLPVERELDSQGVLIPIGVVSKKEMICACNIRLKINWINANRDDMISFL
jgi:hypothetical protein